MLLEISLCDLMYLKKRHIRLVICICKLSETPVAITITGSFVLSPLEDRGCIAKQSSVCFWVSIGRLEQECYQLTTKSSGRPQLCRQPVPCSRCGDSKSPVANSSMCPQHKFLSHRKVLRCCHYEFRIISL